MIFSNEITCVARRRGDPRGAARRSMPAIGRAPQRGGRPPARNPQGRGLLRRGFVVRLARSPGYGPSPVSCPRRKIPSAQVVPFEKIML
jgi:hypothetical protein